MYSKSTGRDQVCHVSCVSCVKVVRNDQIRGLVQGFSVERKTRQPGVID